MTLVADHVVSVSSPVAPSDAIRVECRGFVYQDEDKKFCAYATRLPGVYGEGDTAERAFSDLCDAFTFALESCSELQKEIPWRDKFVRPDLTGIEFWAVVHVKKATVS